MLDSPAKPVMPGDPIPGIVSRAQRAQRLLPGAVTLLCIVALSGAVWSAAPERFASARVDEPVTPLPELANLDPAKVRLGERLFRDARLSYDNSVSCASCHQLDTGGDDGQVQSIGADGRPLDFNTPTVLNAALNFRLNWRGDFRTLEEQAEAVLLNPRLMGARWEELVSRLTADDSYREAFQTVFGGPPARLQILDALAVFQRSLITPGAPFDRYLRGESDAIDRDEKRGYELFKSHGCIACHQGVNIGGNLFQRFGIFHDPFADRPVTDADLGRFALTGSADDRFVFRVPSLRNVAATAPYFHDGSAATLEQAVAEMARSQLGKMVPPQEIDLIVRFLHTLTGEYGGRSVADQLEAQP